MSEKTCIRCGGSLQLGCDGVCMICLRRQGDEYARTGDIRVLFGRTYHSSAGNLAEIRDGDAGDRDDGPGLGSEVVGGEAREGREDRSVRRDPSHRSILENSPSLV